MREHELELILSVLDGTAEDPDAALEMIHASEELASEYRAQLRARSALESLGHAALADDESAALRRDVWTSLRQESAPLSHSRAPWYYRWIPAAGVGMLVLLVGINVLSQGGQDSGGAAVQDITSALGDAESVTTTAGASGDGEGADGAEAPAAEDLAELRTAVQDLRAEILEFQSSDDAALSPTEESSVEDLMACLDEAGAGDLALIGLLPPDEDGGPIRARPLIAAAEPEADLRTAEITLVDATTCEVVFPDD